MGKDVGQRQYVAAAPTFINTTGATMKIKDLVPSGDEESFDGTSFFVIIWSTSGSPMKVKNDPWIKANAPDLLEDYGNMDVRISYNAETKKWWLSYDFDDETEGCEMSDYEIAAGVGYTYYAGTAFDEGLTVTCSGAVDPDDLPVEVGQREYARSGNIAPKDIKVSDLIPEGDEESFDGTSFFVLIWSTTGSPMKVKNDPWIKANAPDLLEDYGNMDVHISYNAETKKWWLGYDFDDETEGCELTNYPITAGQGFSLYAGTAFDEGMTVTLPSAL